MKFFVFVIFPLMMPRKYESVNNRMQRALQTVLSRSSHEDRWECREEKTRVKYFTIWGFPYPLCLTYPTRPQISHHHTFHPAASLIPPKPPRTPNSLEIPLTLPPKVHPITYPNAAQYPWLATQKLPSRPKHLTLYLPFTAKICIPRLAIKANPPLLPHSQRDGSYSEWSRLEWEGEEGCCCLREGCEERGEEGSGRKR